MKTLVISAFPACGKSYATDKLRKKGYKVLAPKLSNIKTNENGFVIFEDDVSDNPIIIESDFIENCLKSENIIVCNKDGYVGNTPYSVKPDTYKTMGRLSEMIGVKMIYYTKIKTGLRLEIEE